MYSPSDLQSLDGQESVSDQASAREGGQKSTEPSETMKRAAAKQLIERYYYQLKDGCGNENCANENCASSSSFKFSDVSCNNLAITAISLSKEKTQLCERRPPKLSKYPPDDDKGGDGDRPSTSLSLTASSRLGASVARGAQSSSASQSSIGSSSHCSQVEHFLNEEKLEKLILECEASDSWSRLIRTIGSVFSDPAALALSFRKTENDSSSSSSSASSNVHSSVDKQDTTESSECGIKESSVDPEPLPPVPLFTVDIESLRRSYSRLMNIPDLPFQAALINALITLSKTLEIQLKYSSLRKNTDEQNNPDYINIFIIVLEIPLLHSPEFLESAFPCVCRAVQTLPLSQQAKLAKIWSQYRQEHLLSLVQSLQQLITVKVINNEGRWSSNFTPCEDSDITSATSVLKVLFFASILGGELDNPEIIHREKSDGDSIREHLQGAFGMEPKDTPPPKEDLLGKECSVRVLDCRKPLIPYEDFINDSLNNCLDIGVDYTNYRLESDNKFSFVRHNFILTTASKHTSMYFDNRISMLHERRSAFMQTLVQGGPPNPFLRVRVRRDHLVDDALVNLEMIAMENPSDLRKQLFVEFDGEQGLDEGGVSKEFFQLIVEELFNPDIGMFTYNEQTHHFWFNSSSFENDAQFTLIGILLGLAIYNSCILDIHFPMVVYRKLLGKVGLLDDLVDVDPTLMHSLKEMLEYQEDDLVSVFDQTFRIGYKDVYGNTLTHDLKEGGDQILVTQENKKEFVDLYADYLLNQSIERQFGAFKRGFLMVTAESPLKYLFRPEELEMLVCGSKNFDFYELEEATEYDGGFTQESPTIKNFWTVVHEMSETEKRKLLQFTTGTDRVPVGGLSKLKMIVARNGPDSERLPTSHTCFNVLLLPEYPTVEKMRDRLTKAIHYSKGFGML